MQGFFENLFTSEHCDVETVLQGIPQKVDAHMNGELCQPYADEEVKAAFF